MSERALWLANDDGLTTAYELQRGPSATGPWTTIATIADDRSDLTHYLPGSHQFFYDDASGTAADFYRVRAGDGSNLSPWSEVRQPEPPLPPRCKIHGRIRNLDGTVIEKTGPLEVLFHITLTEKNKAGQFVDTLGVSEQEVSVFADADGDWEADLVQGAEVVITVPTINLVKLFVVPAQDTAELTDLI